MALHMMEILNLAFSPATAHTVLELSCGHVLSVSDMERLMHGSPYAKLDRGVRVPCPLCEEDAAKLLVNRLPLEPTLRDVMVERKAQGRWNEPEEPKADAPAVPDAFTTVMNVDVNIDWAQLTAEDLVKSMFGRSDQADALRYTISGSGTTLTMKMVEEAVQKMMKKQGK